MEVPDASKAEGCLARLAAKVRMTAGQIRSTRRDFQEWKRRFSQHPLFRQLLGRIAAAWRILKDPTIPSHDKALILAAVAYVVMPLDLIPDVLAGIGLVDDLAVITLALSIVWRNRQRAGCRKKVGKPPAKPRV